MTWTTHEVQNQSPELIDYNPYTNDVALQAALARGGAQPAQLAALERYGAQVGAAAFVHAAEDANRHTPELLTHDRQGRRLDTLQFHPAWHEVMQALREAGLVTYPHSHPGEGAWATYAAGLYLHGQIEAGSLCPTVMTMASVPVLAQEPALFAQLRDKLFSTEYDARDVPIAEKRSIQIGMGMTEKQGGSDLRTNTTRATALEGGGRGTAYQLVGHKWFFSAPMSDAHLVLARAEGGLSCFFVPRWKPDGTRNGIRIQRLKDKLGNRSNSSSEVEFQDAWGIMVGEEGRGIPTIITMATFSRLTCVIGSASLMRAAVTQAVHHARGREAFGHRLIEQPLMQNLLADLALESEAAATWMMRLATAFGREDDPTEQAWARILMPAAKFWVCKRAVELAGEAMEVFGGNGYVETGPMARLFRESPVNSIWEGSGNVICLDVLRAISREPEAAQRVLASLAAMARGDARLEQALQQLQQTLQSTPADALAGQARRLVQQLALVTQGALLRAEAPAAVAEAFIASRFDGQWGRVFGTLPEGVDVEAILARATPVT